MSLTTEESWLTQALRDPKGHYEACINAADSIPYEPRHTWNKRYLEALEDYDLVLWHVWFEPYHHMAPEPEIEGPEDAWAPERYIIPKSYIYPNTNLTNHSNI